MIYKLYRLFVSIAIGANIAGAIVLLLLVIAMNFDVVSRGVFHAPFRGMVEVVVFSMILIVFLQLPDVIRTSRLTHGNCIRSGVVMDYY